MGSRAERRIALSVRAAGDRCWWRCSASFRWSGVSSCPSPIPTASRRSTSSASTTTSRDRQRSRLPRQHREYADPDRHAADLDHAAAAAGDPHPSGRAGRQDSSAPSISSPPCFRRVIIGSIFNVVLRFDGSLNAFLKAIGLMPVDWLGNGADGTRQPDCRAALVDLRHEPADLHGRPFDRAPRS